MENSEHTPDLLSIVDKWLEITIDQFRDALDTYEIGKLDGELWKSIVGEVISSGREVEAVIIEFMQYGRFVDMGVGRGMTTGTRKELGKNFFKRRNAQGQLHSNLRKAKPWYSKTKFREIATLRELMARKLSDTAISEVEGAIRGGLNIDF